MLLKGATIPSQAWTGP